jgi:hypothetical protein
MTFCGRGFGAHEDGARRSERAPSLPARVSVYDAQGRRHRRPARLGALADIDERRRAAG